MTKEDTLSILQSIQDEIDFMNEEGLFHHLKANSQTFRDETHKIESLLSSDKKGNARENGYSIHRVCRPV